MEFNIRQFKFGLLSIMLLVCFGKCQSQGIVDTESLKRSPLIVTINQLNSYKDKSAITYQGSTYLLTDGCEPPKCNENLEECRRIRSAVLNLYSYCRQSQHDVYPVCLKGVNLPVYASVCSALCHESDPEKLRNLAPCPEAGEKDEALSNHFLKK